MNKLSLVLLVDDHDADNFYHKMLFTRLDCAEKVEVRVDGKQALDFLTTEQGGEYPCPELILLDINMPVMDGWEFLKAYEQLPEDRREGVVLMMVSTSVNVDDHVSAKQSASVRGFISKPLSLGELKTLLHQHFPSRFDFQD